MQAEIGQMSRSPFSPLRPFSSRLLWPGKQKLIVDGCRSTTDSTASKINNLVGCPKSNGSSGDGADNLELSKTGNNKGKSGQVYICCSRVRVSAHTVSCFRIIVCVEIVRTEEFKAKVTC